MALLPAQRDWLVTLDRTHGQFGKLQINILLVGLVFQGVSSPLYWTLLPKKGNSNTLERIALMEQVWSYPGLVESFPLDSQATFSYCFSNFMGAWLPRAEWRRCGLYHPSIKVKTAIRASALV